MKEIIKHYQNNKELFWIDCLESDPKQREYLYNEFIEDYFNTSTKK